MTFPGLAGPDQRLWLVALMVAACVLPAILFVEPFRPDESDSAQPSDRGRQSSALTMWFARLLVQIAEAALFAYLLLYFRSLDPLVQESRVARLFSAVLAAAFPIALLAGRWADRSARPALPLAICAFCSGCGLLGLVMASNAEQATIVYVWFGLATTVFLSLHSGQTMRVLPSAAHRGRDLGLFNLTNTVPSLIMPWLTLDPRPPTWVPGVVRRACAPRFHFVGNAVPHQAPRLTHAALNFEKRAAVCVRPMLNRRRERGPSRSPCRSHPF